MNGANGKVNTKKKKFQTTQARMKKAFQQAKDSVKIIQTLEKETLAKAKTLIKVPDLGFQMKKTNSKILTGLKKMGVATHDEISALEAKVKKLESLLLASKSKATKTSANKTSASASRSRS